MPKVILREDETVDELLRRFKRKVLESGVIEECRRREYFLPKALKRKEKSKRAKILALKEAKKFKKVRTK